MVGRNVPAPIKCFEELKSTYNVDSLLMQNLQSCGYDDPTAVQKQAMTAMLEVSMTY